MSDINVPVRVYVGVDRSQLLAVKVLEYSIRRHTDLPVEVHPMLDLPLPEPKDPRQGKRTGFSFARFAIPQLAGYRGRALYLDADMQVFKDIRSLWCLPFNGAKVIIQDLIPEEAQKKQIGAPKERIKQTAVMLLDCAALDWDPVKIIQGLDGRYTYEDLVYQLCILKPDEIHYDIPFEWNSLEFWNENTCLLHYTDMQTQPWVSPSNELGYLWLREVKRMLEAGAMSLSDIQNEIELGYFRPSLMEELGDPAALERFDPERAMRLEAIDKAANYVKHKAVSEAGQRRKQSIREYEEAAKNVAARGTRANEPIGLLGKILTALTPVRAKALAKSKRSI
jgi:lipopolysaccharide biosynthesis glycosyltransferase